MYLFKSSFTQSITIIEKKQKIKSSFKIIVLKDFQFIEFLFIVTFSKFYLILFDFIIYNFYFFI